MRHLILLCSLQKRSSVWDNACHWPNTEQYLAKKSSWHRGKNPYGVAEAGVTFSSSYFYASPPWVAEHKPYQTYFYCITSTNEMTESTRGYEGPKLLKKTCRKCKKLFPEVWGALVQGDFLGLLWAVFWGGGGLSYLMLSKGNKSILTIIENTWRQRRYRPFTTEQS